MAVAMMTTARRPQYLKASMASFFERDPLTSELPCLHVMVDDADSDAPLLAYPPPPVPRPNAVVRALSERAAKRRSSWSTSRRIAANYHRCLEELRGIDGLVLQDDIEFAHGWLGSLKYAVNYMRAKKELANANGNPFRWALTLYSRGALGVGDCCTATQASVFYGSVAMYWPASELAELCTYFDEHADSGRPDDLLIKDYLVSRGVGLYAMNPNIVRHTGVESSRGADIPYLDTSNFRPGSAV